MKVRVPMMVDDARFAPLDRPDLVEGFDIDREDAFYDGPATTRVVVVDRDERTGALLPGAEFEPPRKGRVLGTYKGAYPVAVTSRIFNQVSVFATVLKTIYMYEEPDTLGRRVGWVGGVPRLTIVPRAGTEENAYYNRRDVALLFHSFRSRTDPDIIVHTSLARDIVAHETGHAILDGIAPHLWHAQAPQSLALHEVVADLSALFVSLRSNKLIEAVLRKTQGSIEHSTHFSAVGEEFGFARGGSALRDLKNDLTMADVSPSDWHALSQPLTGAIYAVLIKLHAHRKREAAERRSQSEYSSSGYALYGAAQQLKRMTLRALDYLPPGEVSFADYGRAILAADQASHPADDRERDWLVDELVRRGIVPNRRSLDVTVPAGAQAILSSADAARLAGDDEYAESFVATGPGRELLRLPPHASVAVLPRLHVTKVYYHRLPNGELERETVEECLFKVNWEEREPAVFPGVRERAVTVGTTLAWDCRTGAIRGLLTSDNTGRPAERALMSEQRDTLLRRLGSLGLFDAAHTEAGLVRLRNTADLIPLS